MTTSAFSDLLDDDVLLTDGGLETVLVFHEGIDLPAFAAFPLLDEEAGRRALRRYFNKRLERKPVIVPVLLEL